MGGMKNKRKKNPENFKYIAHIENKCYWKNTEGIENDPPLSKNSVKRDSCYFQVPNRLHQETFDN